MRQQPEEAAVQSDAKFADHDAARSIEMHSDDVQNRRYDQQEEQRQMK